MFLTTRWALFYKAPGYCTESWVIVALICTNQQLRFPIPGAKKKI